MKRSSKTKNDSICDILDELGDGIQELKSPSHQHLRRPKAMTTFAKLPDKTEEAALPIFTKKAARLQKEKQLYISTLKSSNPSS
jgi:hypothetical protein